MMQALFAQADEDFSHIDQQEVVTALKDVLPAAMVLHTDEQLRPYECDSFMLMAHLPLAVVLPETEAQVVIAIQTCARLGVPIVARDRKSTRLNSSHVAISYAVFCLKKKN